MPDLTRRFAYVGKEQHTFKPWRRKKFSWRALCSCGNMLEKTGTLEAVVEAWAKHIEDEGVRREEPVVWDNMSSW
jgi:hypothetical protein